MTSPIAKPRAIAGSGVGAAVVLRPFETNDAGVIARLAGQREVSDTMISIPHPFHVADVRRYLHDVSERERAGTGRYFAAECAGRLVGGVSIGNIDRPHGIGELSFWIGVPFWGRGLASDAASAALPVAFDQLSLNRLQAFHMVSNVASARVLAKLGFEREGVMRDGVFKQGLHRNVALCALLARQYRHRSE